MSVLSGFYGIWDGGRAPLFGIWDGALKGLLCWAVGELA